MRVYITMSDRKSIGGGFSFNQNLKQALQGKVEFVNTLSEADIFLISGITQTEKGQLDYAKQHSIPVVFRVDNIPKPSRNRGMDVVSRFKQYSEAAEVVVYQSDFAKKLCERWCGDGIVIYNGVDTALFNSLGKSIEAKVSQKEVYLFVNHSSNVNKRFEEALYKFSEKWRDNQNIELWLVGRCDGEEHNYDFIAGEKVRNFGVIEDRKELARIYRSADYLLYPAFADACPNVVLEARASGLIVAGTNPVGGTQELLKDDLDISLKRMGDEYLGLFNLVMDTPR